MVGEMALVSELSARWAALFRVPSVSPRRLVLSSWALVLFWMVTNLAAAQEVRAPIVPDGIPPDIFRQMLGGHKLIGSPGLAWKKRRVTVAFNGGSDPLYALIESAASEWTAAQDGELQFAFRDGVQHFLRWSTTDINRAADIRVAFISEGNQGGYWSVIGVLAENVAANEPTLNLGGFPQKLAPYLGGHDPTAWRNSYEHTVVLHEFGHALGLSHEHFNPECQADLKRAKAITLLMQRNRWSEEQARFNVDAEYYFQVVDSQAGPLDARPISSPATDRASVMLYNFPDDTYTSGAASPCKPNSPLGYATTLSSGDVQFFLNNYKNIPSPF